MRAVKGQIAPLRPGDVLVLAGVGPMGTGMAEIASITIALKLLPWGREIALLTDGRFSGVSTGPCIGHLSPEALAGGPIGRLRDGDLVELAHRPRAARGPRRPRRPRRPPLHARGGGARAGHPRPPPRARAAPAPARRHAALGACCRRRAAGRWGGCMYDVDAIADLLAEGLAARAARATGPA